MKKCIKRIMIISVFLLCMIGLMSSRGLTVHAKESWDYKDCIQLEQFVSENFATFVAEYNQQLEPQQKHLEATSIEYSSIIHLIEDNNYGIYFDFNDENGYCVMTGDYTIYALEVIGDLKELKTILEINYSYVDGFVYVDDNGVYQKMFVQKTENFVDTPSRTYPGQSRPGDGEISRLKINEYVNTRYPDYNYEDQNINLRNNFEVYEQTILSYFNQTECNAEGKIVGDYESYAVEGNCALTAMTCVLSNWEKFGFINGIDYAQKEDIRTSIKSNPQFDKWGAGRILYSKNGDAVGEVEHGPSKNYPLKNSGYSDYDYYCWIVNKPRFLIGMNKLYSNLREYAVNYFGYTPVSGLYDYQALEALNNVPKIYYNKTINVESTDSLSSAIDSIDQGKAVYLGINGSSTYQNHAVAFMGYQKYSYTTGWWVFKKTHYVYFFEIADGWNNDYLDTTYFDPNTDAKPTLKYIILS